MAERINVAELFATMGLDASDLVNEIRGARDKAQSEFSALVRDAQKTSDQIKQALSGKVGSFGADIGQLEASRVAFSRLVASGVGVQDALRVINSEAGRLKLGLTELDTSTSNIGKSLRALGVSDIETRFRGLGTNFAVVTEAFDKGQISQRAYTEALRSYGKAANEVSDFVQNKSVPAQTKYQEVVRMSAQSLRQMGEDLSFVGLRFTALISGPLAAFGLSSLKLAGDMERADASMTRLTGNAALAGRTLQQIRGFALESPFEFKGALEGTRRIMAMGFSAESALPMLRSLGDATAAVGGDTGTLNRFIKALGDIQAKGFLAGEEIRQLSNIPVPAVALIARELGISTSKVLEGVKDKSISATTAISALMNQMRTQFGGEMQAQAQTLNVMWKNVKEQGEFALADIGKALTPLAKDFAAQASEIIQHATEMARSFAQLPKPVQEFAASMGLALAVAGPGIFIFGQLVGSFGHIGLMVKSLGGFGALVMGLTRLIPLARAAAVVFVGWKLTQLSVNMRDFISETDDIKNLPNRFDGTSQSMRNMGSETQNMTVLWHAFTDSLGLGFTAMGKVLDHTNTLIDNMKTRMQFAKGFLPDLKGRTELFGAAPVAGPGGQKDITNLWKQKIDQQFKDESEARVRKIEADKEAAEKAERAAAKVAAARAEMFSVTGIDDYVTELRKFQEEYTKSASITSEMQKEIQHRNWVDLLTKSLDSGVISLTRYNELLAKVPQVLQTAATTTLQFRGGDFLVKGLAQMDYALRKWQEDQRVLNLPLRGTGNINPALVPDLRHEVSRGLDAAALDLFNIKPDIDLEFMRAQLDRVYQMHSLGRVRVDQVNKATLDYYRAAIKGGAELNDQQKKHYEQILRQVEGVRRMENLWKGIKLQVSTIITDFSRSAIDILIPRGGAKDPFSSDIMSGLQRGYQGIAAAGYSNPRAALESTIQQIKNATTLVEANRIAVKAFGDIGPEIAHGLREGTLSSEKLAEALDKVSSSLSEADQKGSKFKQLMDEVKRSILRAFAEEAAKAVADFVGKHLRRLISNLDEILGKIPLIGRGLEKIFGIGGAKGGFDISQVPGINVGTGAPAPQIPGGIPGVPGGGGGAAGAAGAATSSLLSTIGVVAGVGSLISSVVGNFQMAGMNKTLDLLEREARIQTSLTESNVHQINNYLPELSSIRGYLWDTFHPAFVELLSKQGSGGSGDTFNIYINGEAVVGGEAEAVAMLETGARELRRRGYRGSRG